MGCLAKSLVTAPSLFYPCAPPDEHEPAPSGNAVALLSSWADRAMHKSCRHENAIFFCRRCSPPIAVPQSMCHPQL